MLLSAPDYVVFDRQRMALERRATGLAGIIPSLRTDHKIYEEERKQASALPHRNNDLEVAVTNLQFGPLAARVHAILDRHLAALPPKSEQDESHLRWRLAIHRMDVRQLTMSEVTEPASPGPDGESGEAKRYIRLEPKAPEADVQAMIDEGSARFNAMNARLGVYMWGLQLFQGETGRHDPSQWRDKLAEARMMDREAEQPDGSRHAPGFVAAVCVRDHWEEMSDDERDWCVDVAYSEVFRQADAWNMLDRSQRFDMAADRPSAFIIARLMTRPLSAAHASRVRDAFVAAITHPIEEVRWYAIAGIDTAFWAANPDIALRSVNATATEALLIDRALTAEERRRYDKRRPTEEIFAEAAATVRQHFWQGGAIAQDAHVTLDISQGFGAHVSAMILAILGQAPDDPVSIAAFERASQTLVDWWDAGDDRKNRRDRNFHTERAELDRVAQFLMRATAASAQKVLARS